MVEVPKDKNKKGEIEKLKKEIAELKYEEDLLRKRDDRLKWEEGMLEKEEELKHKHLSIVEESPMYLLDEMEKDAKARKTPLSGQAEEKPQDLEPGLMYLVKEDQPDRSVKLFINEKKKGRNGLYITRSNPEHVKKRYNLDDKTKTCWLTTVKASANVQSVSGLQELSILISNFIDENNNSVILLDGLEYLISNNEFQIVLRLVQQVRDRVSTSDSIMLVPINQNALEQKQLTLLERECRVIP